MALNETVPAGLQVKGRLKEVQLHKSGPLGDSILECYNSGSRNVFALGFVPVKGENTVVLLGRDTQPNASGIRDLNLDLSTWQPLIGEASKRSAKPGKEEGFGKTQAACHSWALGQLAADVSGKWLF